MNTMEETQIKDNLSYYTYTTGAHLTPIFYEGKWIWMVTGFDDDTYCDGECISPDIEANSIIELGYKDGIDPESIDEETENA